LNEIGKALTQGLAAVARADLAADPSPEVRQRVLTAWDRRASRDRARSGLAAFAIAATTACLVVRYGPAPVSGGRPAPPSASVSPVERAEPSLRPAGDDREVAVADAAETPLVETPAAKVRTTRSGRPLPVDRARGVRDMVTFVPLWPGDRVTDESLRVMRVRLSRASLAGFGLPLDELGIDAHLQADVLVGEDGVARAIRLVPFD
jgi:hypothetical protein